MKSCPEPQCFDTDRTPGLGCLVSAVGVDMHPVGFCGYEIHQEQGRGYTTAEGGLGHIVQISTQCDTRCKLKADKIG
jgi:hypothetical protein